MPAAGDDLRAHLIVPSASSSTKVQQPLSQGASSVLDPASQPGTPRFHKPANRKAENINMEVDYPTQPTTLALAHARDDATITAPLDGVYSLDDYLSTHQVDFDAQIAARETSGMPPAKKAKTSTNSTPLQPVAVSARTSKYTILLHEKYQALAIPQPVFTFSGNSVTRWAVEVSFPGLANAEELQGLKEEGRFNSKQEAKEAASRTALAILEELEQAGRVTRAGKAKKPKGEPVYHLPKEKEEPSENFVGQLLEFQRATSGPQPTYTDYQLGPRWACLMELEGHPNPFGSLDAIFGSKKAARQNAAGCAVAYFKSRDQWPKDFTNVGGIKKRKPGPTAPTLSSANGQQTTAPSSTGAVSATQQVATLAIQLNLGTPEWRFTHEDPSAPDIHSVSCFFKDGGAHAGPMGEVRNIFGKKKAKEECARLTLQYLAEVKKKREDVARQLMAGIAGGDGVVDVGVGMAMDGEEGVKERLGAGMGMDEADDELDIFEDAMEF